MSDVQCLMKNLEEAEHQFDTINGEPDYALEAMYAESDEEEARLEECDRRQAKARRRVEQEIDSLKQRIASMK